MFFIRTKNAIVKQTWRLSTKKKEKKKQIPLRNASISTYKSEKLHVMARLRIGGKRNRTENKFKEVTKLENTPLVVY